MKHNNPLTSMTIGLLVINNARCVADFLIIIGFNHSWIQRERKGTMIPILLLQVLMNYNYLNKSMFLYLNKFKSYYHPNFLNLLLIHRLKLKINPTYNSKW
jgi:hypothetical protein